ncbi:hypothetical protein [Vibrio parahaemolyticus]|uniref:hypothetical protein n=1 Tax=Vibrio parahaemolyticus TaxID=670 RepID=UPI000C86BC69|nr:hypothetical protein [Vibrio parahaemolyticus]EIA1494025.1 hypothetical protein [Vibrio parahaemolyticus]ELA7319230.1 hypothetical protein [Vibrio parahaemolyticus]ELB2055262.1 hypothetical protein [Vibrio parahaemolyticus]PMT62624.1 hypothetical protein C1S87_03610 [Vibrio parahaemolyticus]PMT89408.1 hypothetical protein C1S83_03610 [Vibrio parahaemolyticus]
MAALRELQQLAKLWGQQVEFNEEQGLHYFYLNNLYFIESKNHILVAAQGDSNHLKIKARELLRLARERRESLTRGNDLPSEAAISLFTDLRDENA